MSETDSAGAFAGVRVVVTGAGGIFGRLGRASGPDDAPNAVLFLCSAQASFITGATLAVDGGNSLGTIDPTTGPGGGPPGSHAAGPTR